MQRFFWEQAGEELRIYDRRAGSVQRGQAVATTRSAAIADIIVNALNARTAEEGSRKCPS